MPPLQLDSLRHLTLEAKPTHYEENHFVDGAVGFAVIGMKKAEGDYLIIVARLGTGEASRLNQIRLAAAEEYCCGGGTI